MKYYPLLLDLKGKKCVVVGGGRVAQRKVRVLMKAKACVWVISPDLVKGLKQLKRRKTIFHLRVDYEKKYLKGAFLVIAATDNEKINQAAAIDAQALGMLANVVDSPSLSNFIVPSIITDGDLIISISTSARAPGLSKRIRKEISQLIIPRYARLLSALENIRAGLKRRYPTPSMRAKLFNRLVNTRIPESVLKNKSRIKPYLEAQLKDIEQCISMSLA